MRIFDKNDIELENPDFELGHLVEDKLFIQHHAAVLGCPE